MNWVNDSLIQRWHGEFPEPDDVELLDYGWMGDASRCGSEAGFRRHQRTGTPTCDRCKAAHARGKKAAYRERKKWPTTTSEEG